MAAQKKRPCRSSGPSGGSNTCTSFQWLNSHLKTQINREVGARVRKSVPPAAVVLLEERDSKAMPAGKKTSTVGR